MARDLFIVGFVIAVFVTVLFQEGYIRLPKRRRGVGHFDFHHYSQAMKDKS
jgi:hypothetical protein